MIEVRKKVWFAIPDDDPYRTVSVKESAIVPKNNEFGQIEEVDSNDDHDSSKSIESENPEQEGEQNQSMVIQVSDILGQPPIDDSMTFKSQAFSALTGLDKSHYTEAKFESSIGCYMQKVFELIKARDKRVLKCFASHAMVCMFSNSCLVASAEERANVVVEEWMNLNINLDERFMVSHEVAEHHSEVIRFESYLTINGD